MRFLTATNDVFVGKNKHYVTMYVACELADPTANARVSRERQAALMWRL